MFRWALRKRIDKSEGNNATSALETGDAGP